MKTFYKLEKGDYWHKIKITGYGNYVHNIPIGSFAYLLSHHIDLVYNVWYENENHKVSILDFIPILNIETEQVKDFENRLKAVELYCLNEMKKRNTLL